MSFFNRKLLQRSIEKSEMLEAASEPNQNKHPDHVVSFMETRSVLSLIRAREGTEYPFRFDKLGVMDLVAALSEVLTPEQSAKMSKILGEKAQAYGKIYGNDL